MITERSSHRVTATRRGLCTLAPGGTTEKNPENGAETFQINNELAEVSCPDSSGCVLRGSGRNPAALQQREAEEHGGISPNPTRFSIYLLPLSYVLPPATIPAFFLCLAQMNPFPLLNSHGKHPPVRNHPIISVALRRGWAIIESAWLTSSTCQTVPQHITKQLMSITAQNSF